MMKGLIFLLVLGVGLSAGLSIPDAEEEVPKRDMVLERSLAEEVDENSVALEPKEAEEVEEGEMVVEQEEVEREEAKTEAELEIEEVSELLELVERAQLQSDLEASKARIQKHRSKMYWHSYPAKCGADDVNHKWYTGKVNKTIDGTPCIKWKDAPNPLYRPGKSYGLGDHNYCRNPSNTGGMWCYTSKSKGYWGGWLNAAWIERYKWAYCKDPECPNLKNIVGKAGCTDPVKQYSGYMDKTKTGKTCAKWAWQQMNLKAKYESAPVNYARGLYDSTPGCYPIDPDTGRVLAWEKFANPC